MFVECDEEAVRRTSDATTRDVLVFGKKMQAFEYVPTKVCTMLLRQWTPFGIASIFGSVALTQWSRLSTTING